MKTKWEGRFFEKNSENNAEDNVQDSKFYDVKLVNYCVQIYLDRQKQMKLDHNGPLILSFRELLRARQRTCLASFLNKTYLFINVGQVFGKNSYIE